jgi:predicted DCC family thiol-disulfide oxidoreductase YuxK
LQQGAKSTSFISTLLLMAVAIREHRSGTKGNKMTTDQGKITVFYDGACPVCVRDRRNYEKMAGRGAGAVCWFDITGRDEELRTLGIDPHKALTELHVRDEDNRIYSELDAYILLMRRVTLLKPLAWLIGLPAIRPFLARHYRRGVAQRLERDGRL